jgi:hypothetical protein
MNCQDINTTEWHQGPTPVDVVNGWLMAAKERQLLIRGEVLSIEQCEILEQVLLLIQADLRLLK